MAVIYESNLLPKNFIRQDVGSNVLIRNNGSVVTPPYPAPGGPRNGSLASASYAQAIINNEHWLAMMDPPMINFFEVGGNGALEDVTDPEFYAFKGGTITVKLVVPPFCRWAEFHFLCAKDMDGATSANTMQYISIAGDLGAGSVTLGRHTGIPFGEDLTTTTKTTGILQSADWIHFAGTDDITDGTFPTAIRLFNDSDEHERWTNVTRVITVSAKVRVYAAAYRVLPAFGTLQVRA